MSLDPISGMDKTTETKIVECYAPVVTDIEEELLRRISEGCQNMDTDEYWTLDNLRRVCRGRKEEQTVNAVQQKKSLADKVAALRKRK